jgi:hypothetical protein
MNKPSTEELVVFLKTSEPHKNVLRALPITVPIANNEAYMFSNISIFFKQYAFIDLERWELIELQTSYGVREENWSNTMAMPTINTIWQITDTGRLILAEIEHDRD